MREFSPEWRAKISVAKMGARYPGRVLAPEHRAKLAEANRLRNAGQEGNRYAKDAPVKGECVYCGAPGQTHDHIVPVTRGGSVYSENVVVACFRCNASKRNRTPEEWLAAGLYRRC